MIDLTYVTGNYGKYWSVKKHFERSGLDINYFELDLNEVDVNDIEVISREKARCAYEVVKRPCFVADSGFYIDNYPGDPGYPGAFVKRSGVSSDIEKLLSDMCDVGDRGCCFVDCLTFYDGEEFFQFFGITKGNLAYEKRGFDRKNAKSNLWYVFIPMNCDKTLAEMSAEEIDNRDDCHTSATEEFIKWYKDKYMKEKVFVKN